MIVSLDQEVIMLKQMNSKWKNRKPIQNQEEMIEYNVIHGKSEQI